MGRRDATCNVQRRQLTWSGDNYVAKLSGALSGRIALTVAVCLQHVGYPSDQEMDEGS